MNRIGKITKIGLISVSSIVLLLALLWGAAELTSKPNFCSSCHFMQPYVEDWKTSSHSDVTCTKCHFPPGFKSKVKGKFTAASMVVNYFTGVYKKSKPLAEIEDASCLRSGCHSEQALNEDVVFKQDIHFNHNSHLNNLRRGKELRCTSCHSQIVQGEHMTVTESTCFLCHFKNVESDKTMNNCTWCHKAPIPNNDSIPKYDHSFVKARKIDCTNCHGSMVVGAGDVLESRCSSCHAETGKLEKISDPEFMHQMHVTDHKVECENCHIPIQHKSIARTEDIFPDCQECHDTPHKAQFDLFSGVGGKLAKNHPNPMYTAGLNCKACHIYHESEFGISGKTIANGKSCERCHGNGYSRLYDQWEENMKEKISLVEIGLDVIRRGKEQDPRYNQLNKNMENLLNNAIYNYELVKTGNVVHNVAYSDELLLNAYGNIQKILNVVDSDATLPSLQVFNTEKPSKCQNCHYGQESKKVEAFGIQFDHGTHILKNKIECLSCHSHQKRHGETTITRDLCLSCHHSQEEVQCVKCHQVQTHFYDGTIEITDDHLPDVMFEAEVECINCHLNEDDVITKDNGRNCSNCHEDEYSEYLVEWQDDIESKLTDIQEKLSTIVYYDLNKSGRQKVDVVRYGMDKIETDNSLGAHNYELISNQLEQYQTIINNL
jgi:nitrate/TMAO reductase-like tetraheme cytochrome c subunit